MEEEIQDTNTEYVSQISRRETTEYPEDIEPKSLRATSIKDAKTRVSDIEVFGDGDLFVLLSKASSEEQGWMKSTKAMSIEGAGVLVQVTTQQRNADGTHAVAEALTFVPGVSVGSIGGNKCLVRK